MHLDIYTDGGARGNPGPAGCGYIIYDQTGNVVFEGYKPLGIATNNQAEYQGAICGLTEALKLSPEGIRLHMDSELVVKQLRGEYKVKNPDMQTLFREIQNVVTDYAGPLEIIHIPRHKNAVADKLSNKAMDQVK